MFHSSTLAIAIGVLMMTRVGCRILEKIFINRGILDHPNPRSSHHISTPRGAGLAVMVSWLSGAIILNISAPIENLPFNLSWLFFGSGGADDNLLD